MVAGSKLLYLVAGVLLLGIADSMIGPYLVLFGTDEANLSPFQVGVFVSLIAVSGLAASTWFGRRYDRSAGRWPAVVAVVAPAAGFLALTMTTNYVLLLLVAASLLGAGMAGYPQLFSLARTHLDRSGGRAAARGNPVLRAVWSLAWAIGPLIGAAALAWHGYRGLLLFTALAFGFVLVPLAQLGATPAAPRPAPAQAHTAPGSRLTRPVLLTLAGFTLFHTAMLSGSVALPLYVTRTLMLSDSDVGLLFSVCAFVEVPVALSLVLLPSRIRKRPLILAGMLLLTRDRTVRQHPHDRITGLRRARRCRRPGARQPGGAAVVRWPRRRRLRAVGRVRDSPGPRRHNGARRCSRDRLTVVGQ